MPYSKGAYKRWATTVSNSRFQTSVDRVGERLDVAVARLCETSRAQAHRLIEDGHVSLDGVVRTKAGERLTAGSVLVAEVPPPVPAEPRPEAIPLSILYEDEHLLAVDKPAGLAVHPGPGHSTGTLVNAVLSHCPDLPGIGGVQRPGIVHRLDRDTSGVILIAKTEAAHRRLSSQLQRHEIKKTYLALVEGRLEPPEALIDAAIGRDPNNRRRMAILASGGRDAQTGYRVRQQFMDKCLVEASPVTGRTHQIRVHFASIGHAVVSDPIYGKPSSLSPRLLLHAWRLDLRHPATGAPLSLEAPLPEDFAEALAKLR